jgi:hypothetical protein
VASAVNSEGYREILGICEGSKEDRLIGVSAFFSTALGWLDWRRFGHLITEDAVHIEKARDVLKMGTLQFRSGGSSQFSFDDWAEAPALIANLVAPHQESNTQAAIKAHLATKGIDMLASEQAGGPDEMTFSGQIWSPISVPGFDDLKDVHVAIPVEGKVTRGRKGEVRSVAKQPSAEQVEEVSSFVRSLAQHGQIAGHAGKDAKGTTHQIETDKKGTRRLVRKRYSAL